MSGKHPATLASGLGNIEPRRKSQSSNMSNAAAVYANDLTDKDVKVLASVTKGPFHLAIMEALFIRELRPGMNVRDEYRDHELSIKFQSFLLVVE